jgi:tetratricopeptide (TPR) repeat protein
MSKPPQTDDPQDHIAYYSAQIAAEPDNNRWHYERGRWRVVAGDPAGAISDLNEALRLRPDFAWAYYQRGLAREAQGDLDGAAADLQRALDQRIRTSGWRFFLALGRVELRRGNRAAARDALDAALAVQPDHAEALALREALETGSSI